MSAEAKVSATKTKTDTPIEKEAIEASSRSCTFSECNLDPIIKEDALADLDERVEVESDYRMDESTVIYDSIEKYVNYLNSDQRLRSGVGHEERSLLDNVLY